MTIPSHLPGIAYGPRPVTADHTSALILPPRLVVIHDTSNDASAADEASYASTRPLSGATSAHFYVDAGGPLGSLPLTLQAWAAYGYANAHGWHIEMCGRNAGTPGAVPAVTIALTARLVRSLCQLGGIPMVKLSPDDVAAGKRGICGHRDITIGLGVGTHDDPGPKFNWPAFIAAVTEDDMIDRNDVNTFLKTGVYAGDLSGYGDAQSLGTAFLDIWKRMRAAGSTLDELAADVAALKAQPAGEVDLGVLAGQIAAALRPDLEAAAEAAVRRVLGAVDGATPQGS